MPTDHLIVSPDVRTLLPDLPPYLPPTDQCWSCGQTVPVAAANPGTVTLSLVVTRHLALRTFGHATHTSSQVFNGDDFDRAVAHLPSTASTIRARTFATAVHLPEPAPATT